jgi:glycine/D-amino acid oxidase-like deaminating enzyme
MTPMFPAPFLVPYALRGMELWKTAPRWLDRDIDFQARGGLELAFTEAEAAGLESEMGARAGWRPDRDHRRREGPAH